MGSLAGVLEGLSKLEGVKASLIISEAGEILEQCGKPPAGGEKLIRLALGNLRSGENAGRLLEQGNLDQNYIEKKDSSLNFVPLSAGHALVVLASAGANLGRIRYEIKRSRKLFEVLLGDGGKSGEKNRFSGG